MADYVRHLRDIVGGEELLQIPAVSIALRDRDGRVLMARHSEGDLWLLPGGAVEPAETPADAAVREMFEETGLFVRLTGLVGVFGGPEYVVHYRNGHRHLVRHVGVRGRSRRWRSAAGFPGSARGAICDRTRSRRPSESVAGIPRRDLESTAGQAGVK